MMSVRQLAETEIKKFVEFPFELYKNDPYWVGELKRDSVALISLKNPFWKKAERALFMAFKEEKPVGRIMAIINRVHNEYYQEKMGFFGFFDAVDDAQVAAALFDAAEKWLKARGMTSMRGPANPSSNHPYGLLVEGFDSMPAIMMPYNYPYYARLIEGAELKKVKDLLAFQRSKEDKFSERFIKVCTRCEKHQQVTIRRLDLKNLDKDAEIIRRIYNEAWAQNWGFVPLTKEEMADIVKELKPVVRLEGTCVLEAEGKPAGFYICIPNMNHVLAVLRGSLLSPLRLIKALWAWRKIRDARLLMLGVAPEFRQRGIDLILIKHIIEHGVAVWDWAELSWVLEDNAAMIRGIEECGCRLYKRYRLYQKEL